MLKFKKFPWSKNLSLQTTTRVTLFIIIVTQVILIILRISFSNFNDQLLTKSDSKLKILPGLVEIQTIKEVIKN